MKVLLIFKYRTHKYFTSTSHPKLIQFQNNLQTNHESLYRPDREHSFDVNLLIYELAVLL